MLVTMTMRWIGAVLIVMVLTMSVQGADDWAHYLGPNYDLQPSAKDFTAKSATTIWNIKVTTGMCSLTIADSLLYTMGNDGTDENQDKARDFVYCLDTKTGKEKWTFDYPCLLEPSMHPGGPSSTPTIHEGKVYTLSKAGHIFCLDAKTGRKIWEASGERYKPKKPWWGFAASPTVIGDVVIYNIGDRGLALDKNTGQIVWKSDQGVVAYATPKPLPTNMFNRPAVALFTNEAFLVLDPATGKSVATYERQWEEKSNCNATTPYIHNGRIYLMHSAHGMACLSVDGNILKQDWLSEDGKYASEWHAFNTHVIYEDRIYFLTKGRGAGTTGLHSLDAETGNQKWFDEKYGFGNLMRVNDMMIMLSEDGELIWGKLTNGTFKESYRQKILEGLCWAKPILLGNILYARDAQGAVVSLRLE